MAKRKVDNSLYNTLGNRWLDAQDDPVALLRAQAQLFVPWLCHSISSHFKQNDKHSIKIADIGCGGGLISNPLAAYGFDVTGLDRSEDSLRVAASLGTSAKYQSGDAYKLPWQDQSFDVVLAMDFLEHVEEPQKIIAEISRVLKPGGLFFFHTFNRNPLAYLIIIKFVEWLVPNTPKDMHVYHLFIKPDELSRFCSDQGMTTKSLVGVKPRIWRLSNLKGWAKGMVPKDFEFIFTASTWLSYAGIASKDPESSENSPLGRL